MSFVFVDQALAVQGYIALKAYRLTPAAVDNLKIEDYFSPDRYVYRRRRMNIDKRIWDILVHGKRI